MLHRIFGFIVKRLAYLVLVLGLAADAYIQLHSPRQADPASGHVFPVKALGSRHSPGHTLYLTSSGRSLYHASSIVIFASTFGIIGYEALIQKRNRATSLG